MSLEVEEVWEDIAERLLRWKMAQPDGHIERIFIFRETERS